MDNNGSDGLNLKKITSFIIDGIGSGILLCIGCAVYMSVDSKPLGAFLFSLGLFAIITFQLGLYTGKVGYVAVRPPRYIIEVLFTVFGNAIGACIGGSLLNLTRLGAAFSEKSSSIIDAKFSDSPLSILVLAIFCGILMFTAVEGFARSKSSGNYPASLFLVIIPVMVFILCGFNHCVADMAYFFISRCYRLDDAPFYFLLVIIGNAIGCMLIPMMKKLSLNKL